MKTLTTNFVSRNERNLFIKIVLVSTSVIVVHSNLENLKYFKNFENKKIKIEPIRITNIHNDNFGNFDQVHIPYKSPVIAKMISVLKPDFNSVKIKEVADKIQQAFSKYKIEPQIVVAIIDAESSFNHELVSSTGDLSMAQVNVDVWNKEFMRMNLDLIEASKLKVDQAYSLEVMAQILQILKTRHGKKDRRWYALYHSKTKKHKRAYLSKLETRLKLLEKSNLVVSR